MSDSLHTTLPIEYQLQYGTACGNLNGLDSMSQAAGNGLNGVHGVLSQENLFCSIRVNPRPLVIDSLDSLVVGLDRG